MYGGAMRQKVHVVKLSGKEGTEEHQAQGCAEWVLNHGIQTSFEKF
jgi:hypothetical protein